MKKSWFLLFLLGCMVLPLCAQRGSIEYKLMFARVSDLYRKQHYRDAYQLADSIRQDAWQGAERMKVTGDALSRQLLTACWWMQRIGNNYMEDATDSALARYRSAMPRLTRVDRCVCHLLMGELDSALCDTVFLRSVKNEYIEEFCIEKPDSACLVDLTPTMYDLVMMMAIESSRAPRNMELCAQLIDYYRGLPPTRDNLYRLVEWERRRLSLPRHVGKGELMAMTQEALARYRDTDCELVAQLYYEMAGLEEGRSNYVSALAYCDTAIARWPESKGGVVCAEKRSRMLKKGIVVHVNDVAPGQDILALLEVRNVDTLFFAVVKRPEGMGIKSNDKVLSLLKKCEVLKSWSTPVDCENENQRLSLTSHYAYIPGLEPGQYVLIVSPKADIETEGCAIETFSVLRYAVIGCGPSAAFSGYLVDNATGRPVANQSVSLLDGLWVKAKTKTDRHGYFAFRFKPKDDCYARYYVKVGGGGATEKFRIICDVDYEDSVAFRVALLTDRPVYKPGDTVRYVCVGAKITNRRKAQLVAGDTVTFVVKDGDWKTVDSWKVVADEYGEIHGSYAISPDALPGRWRLVSYLPEDGGRAGSELTDIVIEAYKQPKFVVTLNGVDRRDDKGKSLLPQFGDSLAVEGFAAAYSGAPVGGASVKYSVTRSLYKPWWRSWYGGWCGDKVVASDSTVTDADGSFRLAFVPWPDSTLQQEDKPNFAYTIQAEVTDINGETHSQCIRMLVGYENTYLAISTLKATTDFDTLEYRYADINGNDMRGMVQVRVEKLRQPQHPYLVTRFVREGARHHIPEAEYRQRYPHLAYSRADYDPELWPVDKTVYAATLLTDGTQRVAMPKMSEGMYRVSVSCGDVKNSAVVGYVPHDAKDVVGSALFWAEVNKDSLGVGDTLVVRIGSRHKDVNVACAIIVDTAIVSHQMMTVSEGIKTWRIPITEAMLGMVNVSLVAVKYGEEERRFFDVSVPYAHKRLDVSFETFRDKLTPGTQETWTIKVKPPEGEANASLAMTMYDAALNTYNAGFGFAFNPWYWISFGMAYRSLPFDDNNLYLGNWNLLKYNNPSHVYKGKDIGRWRLRMLFEVGIARSGQRLSSDDIARMPTSVDCIVATVGGVGYAESGTARGESGMVAKTGNVVKRTGVNVPKAAIAEYPEIATDLSIVENEEDGAPSESQYMRSNLNTLAFFEPCLHTDKDGTICYSFKVPDLLTQWDIRAMAWDKELRTGSARRSLVTQKQLMIQPNMPRFLRQGDKAGLMAKVVNLTDSALDVKVDFSFEIDTMLQSASSVVHVPARASVPVSFDVDVPVGGTVATYKFVADGGRHKDGEQGPLPLLTNRQAVTKSMAMYMNGQGEKDYAMELPKSATAEAVSLTVEYTANPMRLAALALPYMEDKEDPSNLYLFNSYYVNTLGLQLAQQMPDLKHLADNVGDADSRLLQNEDVKQTLIGETPWLRDAQSEVERMRRIANYYDESRINKQIAQEWGKLKKEQRSDGGWPWMPGGRCSSPYVTQHILRGLGQMAKAMGNERTIMEKKALGFVDNQAYDDYLRYQRYLKKNPKAKLEPTNLNYLYVRSFYADKYMDKKCKEAFDFYYSNLKKHADEYKTLYCQAQLALIFHRNGDKDLARKMVERIRQKALYDDEMGMYWRDNVSGWYFYQQPVATQALVIEAFSEVEPEDAESVGKMQQWLLKQKQTTSWNTDVATLHAIQALCKGTEVKVDGEPMRVLLKHDTLAGGNYLRHSYVGDSMAMMAEKGRVEVRLVQPNKNISWGGVYYQYTEQMDKVEAASEGIKLSRSVYRLNTDGTLTPVGDKMPLKVGDKVRIVLNIACDRPMEYVQMKHFRASCLEPVTTRSGWVWSCSTPYYVAVQNTYDAMYIDRMEKGKYTIETTYYVTNPGTFTLAPAVMQCMYAPEFRATTGGATIRVVE